MRRVLFTTAVVCALFALSGCPSQSTTVTSTSKPPVPTSQTPGSVEPTTDENMAALIEWISEHQADIDVIRDNVVTINQQVKAKDYQDAGLLAHTIESEFDDLSDVPTGTDLGQLMSKTYDVCANAYGEAGNALAEFSGTDQAATDLHVCATMLGQITAALKGQDVSASAAPVQLTTFFVPYPHLDLIPGPYSSDVDVEGVSHLDCTIRVFKPKSLGAKTGVWRPGSPWFNYTLCKKLGFRIIKAGGTQGGLLPALIVVKKNKRWSTRTKHLHDQYMWDTTRLIAIPG